MLDAFHERRQSHVCNTTSAKHIESIGGAMCLEFKAFRGALIVKPFCYQRGPVLVARCVIILHHDTQARVVVATMEVVTIQDLSHPP